MLQIQQYRYYGPANLNKNYPKNIVENGISTPLDTIHFLSGGFLGNNKPIRQLGIQGPPGINFYLNNQIDPIILDETGVFEINVGKSVVLNSINFDCAGLDIVAQNEDMYLIIDTVYETEE